MNNKILSNIKNIVQNKGKIHNKEESIFFPSSTSNKDLQDCTIEEIVPHLLINSSIATIESREKMWVATSMLIRFLTSHTNNLVVMESGKPVGMIGSKEILSGVYSDPSHHFFSEEEVFRMMNRNMDSVYPNTRVYDLLKKMGNTGRDFALVQTMNKEFSTISAKRLLEVGILCDTSVKASDIPAKKVVTFQRDDNIGILIQKMLEYNTDVIILEHTPLFVTSQTILEKISELNYLDNIHNFLDLKANTLSLKTGHIVSDNITIPKMCRIMLGMKNAFVMTQNNVLTPWDLVTALV
jgi:predicted transcriptional regulator